MQDRHFKVWPKGRPFELPALKTSVFENLVLTAGRYPDHPAIIYYDAVQTYDELLAEVINLGAYLREELGVERNDRVLLYMQNSPQFIISYYGILAANAVIVPVNPMCRTGELEHIANDTEAVAIICGQELAEHALPLLETTTLCTMIHANYGDYTSTETDLDLPDEAQQNRKTFAGDKTLDWWDAIGFDGNVPEVLNRADDWCVIPYSSGTTGQPKGCLHTNRTVNAVISAYANWNPLPPNAAILATLPLFHVTGMQNSMNVPIFTGGTIVLMTRWDNDVAARLIERYRVVQWRAITAMIIDFISSPDVTAHDLSSLISVGAGGAQIPFAVAEKLGDLTGLKVTEGYGLTETIAPSHLNPPDAPKLQCLGIPLFGVDSRVIDPETLDELGVGETGEIITHGPQVFLGYWRDDAATDQVFIELDGKRFLRTGDLGYYDEDGYFFHVDRLKRMINVSGYKVWPAEVEAIMHEHPGVQEACVIASPDARKGETVKALVVARGGAALDAGEIEAWCRGRMAAYKVPRLYEFVDALPRSGSGKVEWRKLQELEKAL
ncbi:MAG: AMP-binding protein [Rhizobiales bacterium]|nr:AMP-binding protein [Hyphomicrobiales bacterium]